MALHLIGVIQVRLVSINVLLHGEYSVVDYSGPCLVSKNIGEPYFNLAKVHYRTRPKNFTGKE